MKDRVRQDDRQPRMRSQSVTSSAPTPEGVAPLVQFLRAERVLLDADLAALYGVRTGALNQAVKRNAKRFPADFMFRLTPISTTRS